MTDSTLKDFQKEIRRSVKGDISFDEVTRGIYATDASIYQIMPVAVIKPLDEDDVRSAVRVAAQYKVSILPRGGGTSLGGQGVGPSMVLDFSKYMRAILELNTDERWVRVQPGIVLDELNAALAPHGLHFAPDPATSSRATIGGMIGNNSSGTKSIIYGITRDHVLETTALLADGTTFEMKELSVTEIDDRVNASNSKTREAEIFSGFKKIIEANRTEIETRYPKVMRRVQGYNLDSFINTDRWNLASLLVGSEGTLAVTLQTKLNLEPLPKYKSLCVIHFAKLLEAIRAVEAILTHQPSAVEILDREILMLAKGNLNIAPLCDFVEGDPAAVLIVEFFGNALEETVNQCHALSAELQSRQVGYAWPVFSEPADQAKAWNVRKQGLGLMLGMKGDRKPLAFIEDAGIPIPKLPEYIDQVLTFCKERDVPVAMYAHASVGTIHVRPILNLKVQADIDHMKAIANYAFGLVQQYGGSWSGEHGDGRVRSPFLERFFGAQIYGAFKEVKQLFDPTGMMNPGTIIDPDPMDQNLRYGTQYLPTSYPSVYHYRSVGDFASAVEMCTGIGSCRQNLGGTMCPSYRATRNEEHSTRGRANALRLAMTGQLGPDGMTSRQLYDVMDLCLSCKACKSECPSNVDVARLKSEFLQQYHDTVGTTLRDRLIARSSDIAASIAGWKAPIVNWILRTSIVRLLLEKLTGFDRRRIMPTFAPVPFRKWLADRSAPNIQSEKKVVLFEDTYMLYHQAQIGISAVELLESCGYHVILAQAGCCQRPKISHGFLRDAKQRGKETLRNLDRYIQQGLQVVVCEPSCCSALTDDLPDLIDDAELAKRIRDNVMMLDDFLDREIKADRISGDFQSKFHNILIHGHCHQKSLYGTSAMHNILNLVPGISVTEIDAGCCGMAGSFGMEKEHYALSQQIGESRLFPVIRKIPADSAVVVNGFSCRHQIADGAGVQTYHWVELLRCTKATD